MKDSYKTKHVLTEELMSLRRRIQELEQLEADRKKAEEALRESEEKFRIIFDTATDGILIFDVMTKKFLQGNATICSMLGYTKEEIKNLTIHDIHPPNDISQVLDEFEKLNKGEKTLAEGVQVLRKDGSIFYTDISATSTTFGGKHYFVGIFRDITERKKASESLRKSEERFRLLAEEAHDFVYQMKIPEGVYEYVSPSASRVLGYSKEDLYENTLLIRDIIHPDWREYFEEQWQSLINNQEPEKFEYVILDKQHKSRYLSQRNSYLLPRQLYIAIFVIM
jgi:PAS domain S-box-containing protein